MQDAYLRSTFSKYHKKNRGKMAEEAIQHLHTEFTDSVVSEQHVEALE